LTINLHEWSAFFDLYQGPLRCVNPMYWATILHEDGLFR
jgi:hypothetical protein